MASVALQQDTNLAQTVLKALDILECIAFADSPLSAADAAKLCGVSRPTAYRLISTLLARGYLAHVDDTHYRLGTQALSLSKKVMDTLNLPEVAQPYLRRLSEITSETAYLSILDGTEILYVGKVESSQSVRTHGKIGARNLLHCTAMGKAILAFLPPAEQSRLLQQITLTALTQTTITDMAALVRELAVVKAQNYALDDEESEADIRCVGAPIFDHTGRVFAALSVSGPAYRLSAARLQTLAPLVLDAANTVSGRLGYLLDKK